MQNYSFGVAWSEQDGKYVATSSEFPGLSALGQTAAEALVELSAAIEIAVDAYIEDGEPVPEPRVLQGYSGQLRLRLPRTLHAAAAQRAEEEGVSLNTLLQAFVADGLGSGRTAKAVDSELRALRSTLNALSRHFSMGEHSASPPSPANNLPTAHVLYGLPGHTGATSGAKKHAVTDVIAIDEFRNRPPRQRRRIHPEPTAPIYPKEALL